MQEKEFNLLKEPWIKVLTNDMRQESVSITDALLHAGEYKCLYGETGTQDAAILRLLLSITLTVFYRYDADGNSSVIDEKSGWKADDVLDRWKEWYGCGHFPEKAVREYLEKYEERFWLFHPETPFYQVAGLSYGTLYAVVSMMGDISESNNPLTRHHFSMAAGENLTHISLADAARWLVYYNAYSVNVKKASKAPGPGKPVSIGRLGKLGLIILEGKTLFDTLMYSLCALKDGEKVWEAPSPAWEKPVCDLQGREIDMPCNLPGLYTIQSRRVQMYRDKEGLVSRFRSMGGDYIDAASECVGNEQMTIWGKKKIDPKSDELMDAPLTHQAGVHVWREFAALMGTGYHLQNDDEEERKEKKPGIIFWIEKLIDSGCIERTEIISIRAVSQIYDEKKYKLAHAVDDRLYISAGIMGRMGEPLKNRIAGEIAKCRKIQWALFQLLEDTYIFLYGDENKKTDRQLKRVFRNKLTERYYDEINCEFRQWLSGINTESADLDEKIDEWENVSLYAAVKTAREFVESLGTSAYLYKRSTADAQQIPALYKRCVGYIYKVYSKKPISEQYWPGKLEFKEI